MHPISGSSFQVHYRENTNRVGLNAIDHSVWKPLESISTSLRHVSWPALRRLQNRPLGIFERPLELPSKAGRLLVVIQGRLHRLNHGGRVIPERHVLFRSRMRLIASSAGIIATSPRSTSSILRWISAVQASSISCCRCSSRLNISRSAISARSSAERANAASRTDFDFPLILTPSSHNHCHIRLTPSSPSHPG